MDEFIIHWMISETKARRDRPKGWKFGVCFLFVKNFKGSVYVEWEDDAMPSLARETGGFADDDSAPIHGWLDPCIEWIESRQFWLIPLMVSVDCVTRESRRSR